MNRKRLISGLIIFITMVILYPVFCYFYWYGMAILNPEGSLKISREFEKLPSDVLIKKLYNIDPISPYPLAAFQILGERKEKKAVPVLTKFVKSWNPDRRYQAIRVLGLIGDERAVKPLLEIVNKGDSKNNPNYHEALYSLCQIGYEPVRPIVLEMLKRPDGARNGAVPMIEYIGKKEDTPILEKMLGKIKGNDVNARLDRNGIKKAIESIKSRENK